MASGRSHLQIGRALFIVRHSRMQSRHSREGENAGIAAPCGGSLGSRLRENDEIVRENDEIVHLAITSGSMRHVDARQPPTDDDVDQQKYRAERP
jgi:hypothetical protein